jgi:hypothetical protein
MAIPKKYDRQMRRNWGMRAVWFPGTKVSVGDIVKRAKDGTFQRAAKLKDFGISFETTTSEALKTGFKSAATKMTVIQLGAQVPDTNVEADVDAKVQIEFTKDESFSVATPIGTVETLENLLAIGATVRDLPTWEHRKWFIVRQVLTAKGFSVLGSEKKGRKIEFSGKGKAVLDFVQFGLSAGIDKTSSSALDVEFIGTKGPLAMDLAQIKKNGSVVIG